MLRSKRERLATQKAEQKAERVELLAGLGELEIDTLEDAIDVVAWRESGAAQPDI